MKIYLKMSKMCVYFINIYYIYCRDIYNIYIDYIYYIYIYYIYVGKCDYKSFILSYSETCKEN